MLSSQLFQPTQWVPDSMPYKVNPRCQCAAIGTTGNAETRAAGTSIFALFAGITTRQLSAAKVVKGCLPQGTSTDTVDSDASPPPQPPSLLLPCRKDLVSFSLPLLYHLLFSHNSSRKLTTTKAIRIVFSKENRLSSMTHGHTTATPTVSKQPQRPNTRIHYPVYNQHDLPTPASQLNVLQWEELLAEYSEPNLADAICGIIRFGARIGYEGYRGPIRIFPNLSSAEEAPESLTTDIEAKLSKKRIACYVDISHLPEHFTASSLGLVDKSDGSKRRIHHLSYAGSDGDSINDGIPEQYGKITYSSIEDAISGIQKFGASCQLVKRDFESAFRHIPIAPQDSPLLGFHWQDKYY